MSPIELQSSRGPELDPASPLQFIINAASGSNDRDETRQGIEEALGAAGRTGDLLYARPDEVARTARAAAATAIARRTAVVAVGGDGTISAVAQVAHAEGCAMGVIPQGTFNYFARTHGLPADVAQAVQAMLRSVPVPVQVGLINDRVFLVNASLGLYPQMLEDREEYKRRFGRSRLVAAGAALMTVLRTHRQLRLRIELGGSVRDVTTPTLFVGNNRLQLEQVGLQEADALDEGCIAAVMLRPIGTLSMLWLMCRGAFGSLGEASTVESFKFHGMVIKPGLGLRGSRVKVAMDGEVSWLPAPIEVRVADKPLYVLKTGTEDTARDPEQSGA